MNAADIMTTSVITVGPQADIQTIARLLLERNISGVPVVDEGGTLLGIVTEGDLVMRNAHLHYPTFIQFLDSRLTLPRDRHFLQEVDKMLAATARDLMSPKVFSAQEDTAVEDVAGIMVDKRVGLVPIVRNHVVVGIVSRRDIVRLMVREDQADASGKTAPPTG